MLILSFIFIFAALYFCNKNYKNLIIFLFSTFIFSIISLIYIVADYFTWTWIDESFIYHLIYGIQWAGIQSDIFIITIGIIWIILSIFFPFFIYKKFNQWLFKNTKKNKIAILLLIIAFISHPFTKNIFQIYSYSYNLDKVSEQMTFEEKYSTSKNIIHNWEYKNIIFIYLESFENLYLDKSIFPDLTPNLQNLKNNSLYFNNIDQAFWTSRTIAGMVWSQCGIPLITSWWGGNSMHGMSSFLPWAYCVWDILKTAWYNLNYIWWSDINFAWKWNFYKSHWFNSVQWKDKLIDKIKNKTYFYDWWLYDDSLLDIAYKKYLELSQKNDPFWLFMINLDTHGAKWVVSRSCKNNLYNNNPDSILNSYKCTDFLLQNFIQKIKKSPNSDNTIIVIASDHFAMSHNNSINTLEDNESKRKMLFLILDSRDNHKVINKSGTTLDIWPTILAKMWFQINRLWLWVNLLVDLNSTPNEILKKWKKKYESFWSYPSIKNWLSINIKDKNILLLDTSINFPSLIYIDDNIEIKKILWHDKYSPTSLFQNIPSNLNSLYIDSCSKISNNNKSSEFCILYATKNWKKIIKNIYNDHLISIEQIKEIYQ